MKLVRKLLATAVLGLGFISAGPASAVVGPTVLPTDGTVVLMTVSGHSFNDYFSFSLPALSDVAGGATSSGFTIDLGSWGIINVPPVTFTGLDLTGPGNSMPTHYAMNGSSFSGTLAGLAAGDYFATLSGTTGNGIGAYALALTTVPVPEPGEWALMLAGLGMVGFIVRRRKET